MTNEPSSLLNGMRMAMPNGESFERTPMLKLVTGRVVARSMTRPSMRAGFGKTMETLRAGGVMVMGVLVSDASSGMEAMTATGVRESPFSVNAPFASADAVTDSRGARVMMRAFATGVPS